MTYFKKNESLSFKLIMFIIYNNQNKPVILRNLSKQWPAYTKWTWDYLKAVAGNKTIPIYNNVKSDAYTPINKADGYTSFGEYIDMIKNGTC